MKFLDKINFIYIFLKYSKCFQKKSDLKSDNFKMKNEKLYKSQKKLHKTILCQMQFLFIINFLNLPVLKY